MVVVVDDLPRPHPPQLREEQEVVVVKIASVDFAAITAAARRPTTIRWALVGIPIIPERADPLRDRPSLMTFSKKKVTAF